MKGEKKPAMLSLEEKQQAQEDSLGQGQSLAVSEKKQELV